MSNQKKIFFVADFTANLIGGETIVATRAAITRVTSADMRSLISDLGNHCRQTLVEETLIEYAEKNRLTSKDVVEYLLKAKIIRDISRIEKRGLHPKKVRIFTDFIELEPLLVEAAGCEGIPDIEVAPLSAIALAPEDDTLVCLLMEKYSQDAVKRSYSTYASKRGTWFLTGYLVGRKLFIDNLYDPMYGTPCHFCHVERYFYLENKGQGKGIWSQLSVVFSEQGKAFSTMPMPKIARFFAAHIFFQRIIFFVGHPEKTVHLDSVYLASVTDTVQCTHRLDAVAHWPHCSCIREKALP